VREREIERERGGLLLMEDADLLQNFNKSENCSINGYEAEPKFHFGRVKFKCMQSEI